MNDFWDDLSVFHDALWKNNDDVQGTALKLFLWYGTGAGPWSGYPMRERVPGNRKYLSIPTYRIASALAHTAAVELESRDALVLPVPLGKWKFLSIPATCHAERSEASISSLLQDPSLRSG
jgi:hypothetical protein